MSGSPAVEALYEALEEINALERLQPEISGSSRLISRSSRALGRAAVVLLCSHFERYLYAINEAAVSYLNTHDTYGDKVPESIRLVHSRQSVDALAQTSWENRQTALSEFMKHEGWEIPSE